MPLSPGASVDCAKHAIYRQLVSTEHLGSALQARLRGMQGLEVRTTWGPNGRIGGTEQREPRRSYYRSEMTDARIVADVQASAA